MPNHSLDAELEAWAQFLLDLYKKRRVQARPRSVTTHRNQSTTIASQMSQAPAPSQPRTRVSASQRRTYHLNKTERHRLAALKEKGYTLRAIAKALKRSVSTISTDCGVTEPKEYTPHLRPTSMLLPNEKVFG